MTAELSDQVLAFVRRARSVSAPEIARSLGVSRGDVNRVLYQGLGCDFQKSTDAPPRWSALEPDKSSFSTRGVHDIPVISHHDFHVDFAGGDWKFRIVVAEASLNDPVARVELLGERHRLVTVASYASGRMSGETLPPAAIGIAASVLAWEIHQSLKERGIDVFHFEEAVRDIFLSLTWQSVQLKEQQGRSTDDRI